MIIKIASPIIDKEEKNAVLKVLESGKFVQGENVENFENAFAKYTGSKYAIAVGSGTAALHLSLISLKITNGHDVITPSFSFISSANCALYCGAKPVLSDIRLDTFNIDVSDIREKITPSTKAIVPVHLYGHPADMDEISELATENDFYIVEDCAQANGAEYLGKKVGSLGDVGCFSFYPTKGMTTIEGGMIVTNNEEIAEKTRVLRNIGQKSIYTHTDLGYNYRMNEVEAAIGLCQLKKLDKWIEQRTKNARILTKKLQGIRGIVTPTVLPKAKHSFNYYTIRVKDECKLTREEVIKEMLKRGVETKVYYPIPIHKQPLYIKLGYTGEHPNSEIASGECLSLPVSPKISVNDLEIISEALIDTLS